MSLDEKVACAVNAAVGGVLGVAIFLAVFGGMDFLAGKSTAWWNGWPGLLLSVVVGSAVGVISYVQRHSEVRMDLVGVYEGPAGAWLLVRRIGVLVFAVV